MKNKFLLILGILLLLPMIIAQDPITKEQSTDFNLTIVCKNNGSYCSSSAVCNGTLTADGISLINNQLMTQDGVVYSSLIYANQSTYLGTYQFDTVCCDGTLCNSDSWFFNVTPNGEEPNIAKSILYFGLLTVLLILLIIVISQIPNYPGYAWHIGFICVSYILILSILLISWLYSAEFLTSVPYVSTIFRILWLLSMILFFPFLLVIFFRLLLNMLQEKEIQKFTNMGYTDEEARSKVKNK